MQTLPTGAVTLLFTDSSEFESGRSTGRSLSLDDAFEYALGDE